MQLLTKQLVTFAGWCLTTDMWNTVTREGCCVSGLRLKGKSCRQLLVKEGNGKRTTIDWGELDGDDDSTWGPLTVKHVRDKFTERVPLPYGQKWGFTVIGPSKEAAHRELDHDQRPMLNEYIDSGLDKSNGGSEVKAFIKYAQVDVKLPSGATEHFDGQSDLIYVKIEIAKRLDLAGRPEQVGLFYKDDKEQEHPIDDLDRFPYIKRNERIAKALAPMRLPGQEDLRFLPSLFAKKLPEPQEKKSDKKKNTTTDAGNGDKQKEEIAWWIWVLIAAGVVGVGLLALLVYTAKKSPGEDTGRQSGNDGGNFEFYDSSDSSESEEETDAECGAPADAQCGTKKKLARDVDTSGQAILPFRERSLSGIASNGSANRN